jgi:hypothetical protein
MYVYLKCKSKFKFFKNFSQLKTSSIRFTSIIDITPISGFHGSYLLVLISLLGVQGQKLKAELAPVENPVHVHMV